MPRARRILLLAAGFGLAAQLLFYREWLGLNVVVAAAVLLAAAWSLRTAPLPRSDLWIPAFAMAFAAFVAVRTEEEVVAFDVLAALTLLLATTASLRGLRVTRLPFLGLLAEAWRTATGTLWRAAPLVRPATQGLPVGRGRRVVPYLGGLLLAVPFLFVFVALFTSADPVFKLWWETVIDLGEWGERLAAARDRAIIATIGAWLAGGALAALDRGHAAASRPGHGPLSASAATAFLAALVLLFVAFVTIQVTYLFGGRDTLEAVDMTYSEYARRGFFELVMVASIVAATLFVLDLTVDRRARAYVVGGLALLLLTGVILASALYRLDLYQQAYGWSELRLYAFALLVTVAAALVLIGWAIAAGRMTFALQPIVFVGFGVALLVNAVGPAGFIARANVSRLSDASAPVDPSDGARARGLDHWYAVSLGEGALPDLVAARAALPETQRFCLDAVLYWRYSYRVAAGAGQDPSVAPSWQSWNLDRERARVALASLKEEVFAEIGDPADSKASQALRDRFHVDCMQVRPPAP